MPLKAVSNGQTKPIIVRGHSAAKLSKPPSGFGVLMKSDGFNLVEVLSVVLIISLLSAFAVTKLSDTNADLVGYTESVKSHLRYAQTMAMNFNYNADTEEDRIWGIRLDAGNDQYWMFTCDAGTTCDWSNRQVLPGSDADGNDIIQLGDAGINIASISVGGGNPVSIVFDTVGRPFWVSSASLTFDTPLLDFAKTSSLDELPDPPNDFTISLNDDSGNSKTISVTSETGFVQ